jgi:hypothetical protein
LRQPAKQRLKVIEHGTTMKEVALQSTFDSATARHQHQAVPSPVPVSPSIQPTSALDGPVIQRQANCACGGDCPRCADERHAGTIQTKLTISTPGDRYEQEADRVAEQVMRIPASSHELGAEMTESVGSNLSRSSPQESSRSQDVSPLVNEVLSSTGQPLDQATRSFMQSQFGRDFTRVRVHADDHAAESASSLSARAYTVGDHIVFGAGEYEPGSSRGRQLIAHELTHVVQQTTPSNSSTDTKHGRGVTASAGSPAPGVVQRSLTEEQLATTADTTIRQDPDYLDNRMTRIEFYTAELAIIHYADGSQFRLGLVPGQIQPPVVGVDYRTRRSEHGVVASSEPGQTRFVPRIRQIRAPGMGLPQVIQEFSRTIRYHLDPGSHRIVPTEVNDITAPRLCEVLRRSEAEYVRSTNELAQGAIRILEILEIVLIIASFIPTGGESASAAAARGAGAAGAAEVGVLARAIALLRQFFLRLLRSGATEAITVERVAFGGVRVLMGEGRVMTVLRNSIHNVERIPGQGRLINSAFEQAAVAAAREAGATSVRVGVETVVNAQWAAYLESLGYAVEIIPNATGGFTRVLMRTFTL